MHLGQPIIAVVTRDSRMSALKARWATANQAMFRLQQAGQHEVELRRKRRMKTGVKVAAGEEAELAAAAEALAEQEEYADEDRVYQGLRKGTLSSYNDGGLGGVRSEWPNGACDHPLEQIAWRAKSTSRSRRSQRRSPASTSTDVNGYHFFRLPKKGGNR